MAFTQVSAFVSQWCSIRSVRLSVSMAFTQVSICISHYGVHSGQSVWRSLRSVSMAFTQVSMCVSQYGVHSGQYVCQSVWRSLRSRKDTSIPLNNYLKAVLFGTNIVNSSKPCSENNSNWRNNEYLDSMKNEYLHLFEGTIFTYTRLKSFLLKS